MYTIIKKFGVSNIFLKQVAHANQAFICLKIQ